MKSILGSLGAALGPKTQAYLGSQQAMFGRLTNIIPQKPSMLFDCYSRLISTYTNKHFYRGSTYSINLHSPVKQAIMQSILNKGE